MQSQVFAVYSVKFQLRKDGMSHKAENLPKVMLRLARFYDIKVDQEFKTLSALIEPMALIVMGVVVAVIAN